MFQGYFTSTLSDVAAHQESKVSSIKIKLHEKLMTLTATSSLQWFYITSKITSRYYQSTAKNSNSSLVWCDGKTLSDETAEKIFMSTRHIYTFFSCLINNFFSPLTNDASHLELKSTPESRAMIERSSMI